MEGWIRPGEPNNRTCSEMKGRYGSTLAEAAKIVAAATILGFSFSGIMGKGLFGIPPASTPPATPASVTSTFLSYEEARDLFVRKRALFVDSRNAYDFGAGHVSGAVSIPLQDFTANHPVLSYLSKDQLLIVYCDGEGCNSSVELAGLLHRSGYAHVQVFFGGWTEWIAHGQPTEP
jgi:rhodanese-related sulfurtransferase